jgi:BirA family transcriptional regulator, biotin operon repressor / biotin---[acetyl-CoA-carboxylase] ligase
MIIGSKRLFFKNLPSTNSHAASLIKESEVSEGTVIHANYQSSGRGQQGNIWESQEGKNLLISIILYPSMITPADQFLLSMTVSLGICDFLDRYTSGISVKWPNDIYINNDKIAGILIENSIMGGIIEHTIAGIGININQTKFLSNAPNPVSLANLTGNQYDLTVCLDQLISNLDKRYKCLIGEEYDLIRHDYHYRLYRHNQWCKYQDTNGIFTGRLLSVGDIGRLNVERENGTIDVYSFNEIDFIL